RRSTDLTLSSPAATCEAISTPLAPLSNCNKIFPSSSSLRPSTYVYNEAHNCVVRKPEINSARCRACVPISPMQPLFPDLLGSVRHEACLSPVCSEGRLSQPCGYSTYTLRSLPSTPSRTSFRA